MRAALRSGTPASNSAGSTARRVLDSADHFLASARAYVAGGGGNIDTTLDNFTLSALLVAVACACAGVLLLTS